MAKVQQTEGPYWSKAWIQKMWEFTNHNFIDFDTGAVDFEALGKEEYEFRKAMFFRNFKNSERAKEAFEEAREVYERRVKAGEKGGRPPKNYDQVTASISANCTPKDASRGDSDDDRKVPPSFNPADASTREGEDELTHTGNRGSLESGTSAGNILPHAGAVAPVGNAGDELAMPARVVPESATSVPATRPLRDTIDPVIRDTFEAFRKAYKGQKNGLEVELQNFVRACRKLGYDYTLEVVKLMPAWEAEHRARLEKELSGGFFPHPKNLKTWLNNACWLQTLNTSPDVSQLTQGERIILRNHLMEAQDEQEKA